MTEASGGTRVRPDVIEDGDFVRFFGGNGFHERYHDRWWKVVEVDGRYGRSEPVLRIIDATDNTDMIHINRWVDVVAHDYTYRRILAREKEA
jgi:hypothetical protein